MDFVVCLGGDGTILHASSLFQRAIPPVISFSLGSLGFLTNHTLASAEDDLRGVIYGCEDLDQCALDEEARRGFSVPLPSWPCRGAATGAETAGARACWCLLARQWSVRLCLVPVQQACSLRCMRHVAGAAVGLLCGAGRWGVLVALGNGRCTHLAVATAARRCGACTSRCACAWSAASCGGAASARRGRRSTRC